MEILTVRDICERLAVHEHTVLGWIRSGELKAINVGRSLGKLKPRWRITPEALGDFEKLRTSGIMQSCKPQRKKFDARENDCIDYYK